MQQGPLSDNLHDHATSNRLPTELTLHGKKVKVIRALVIVRELVYITCRQIPRTLLRLL